MIDANKNTDPVIVYQDVCYVMNIMGNLCARCYNHDSVLEFTYFIIVTKRNWFHIKLIHYNASLAYS